MRTHLESTTLLYCPIQPQWDSQSPANMPKYGKPGRDQYLGSRTASIPASISCKPRSPLPFTERILNLLPNQEAVQKLVSDQKRHSPLQPRSHEPQECSPLTLTAMVERCIQCLSAVEISRILHSMPTWKGRHFICSVTEVSFQKKTSEISQDLQAA